MLLKYLILNYLNLNAMTLVLRVLQFVFLTSCFVPTFGQSKSDEVLRTKILGKWEFSSLQLKANEKATDEEKDMVEASKVQPFSISLTYIFKEDGIYEQLQEAESIFGSWKLENGQLTMTNDVDTDSKPVSIKIEKSTLTISSQTSEGLTSFLVLKRG